MLSRTHAAALVAVIIFASSIGYSQQPQITTPEGLSKIAGWKGAAPRSAEAFNFVVASDRTGGHIPGEWAAAVKQINLLKPDFVISVGDLIEGYTDDDVKVTRQWDEFDEITKKLDAPFFYCPGNHDVSNDKMLGLYIKRYGVAGRSYYSFNYRNCHFVVLDSNTAIRKKGFAAEQFDWLAKDLDAAKDAGCVFVFYHHPFWQDAELWARLRGLLPAEKTIIFNGHYHRLSYRHLEGIKMYTLAATSANVGKYGRILGDFRMFAHVSVNKADVTIAMIPLHEVLPHDYATEPFQKDVNKLFGAARVSDIPTEGGMLTLEQSNPLKVPVEMTLTWDAPQWSVTPAEFRRTIKPGESVKAKFAVKPDSPDAPAPNIKAAYTLKNPKGEAVTVVNPIKLRHHKKIDAPRLNVTVDGKIE
ncbi:MAG: metallophosphoesterase, partial [Phycisphaerae bacterium]|nr:metallophosphoesterase [Phycisphaerae bacterium]